MPRTTEILKAPIFSSGEAREFLNVPLPRFQDWLTRKIFHYTEVEQGERRLVRRFSAFDLMEMSIATMLMEQYGLEPSGAALIAERALSDIAADVFARDWERQTVHKAPQTVKDWHPLEQHEFWAIAEGKAYPTFSSTTVLEIATEIAHSSSFIVIDTAPLKRRVLDAVMAKVDEKITQAAE